MPRSEPPPPKMRPYRPARIPPEESLRRVREDLAVAEERRSVRHFSSEPVPREVIEAALRIAGTAPSGAHQQPWHFVALSDPEAKRSLREAAEAEERRFYEERATEEWLRALAPLGTDFVKEHLTDAPWVIVVFAKSYGLDEEGQKKKHYYVTESVGIALGFLIQALHRAGLATLTHTPAPMTFVRELCGRPQNERPYVILPVGYPAEGCEVPDLERRSLEEIAEFVEEG